MTEMLCAGAGLAAGVWLGYRQLLRWKICDRRSLLWLLLGSAILFIPGGYLMKQYDYHILKIIRYWMVMYGLVLLGILDSRRRIIPNKALLVMAGVRSVLLVGDCICYPQMMLEIIVSALAGMLGGGGLFLIAGVIARKGIGMGDVKMIAVMGYFLGLQVLMSDLIVTMTLTVVAGITALVVRKVSLRSEMPFAPFAAVGTIITILMGC